MVTWVRFMSPDTMYVVLGDVPFSHEPQSSQKTLFPPISIVLTLCELSKMNATSSFIAFGTSFIISVLGSSKSFKAATNA